MHGTVSISEAARLLGIERSTLSRYVSRHADALNPERRGRDTVLDFEALKTHRGENIRLDEQPAPAPRQAGHSGTRNDEAAGKLRVQRQLGELDLADRLEKTVPRDEVEEGALYAVTALRNAFDLALDETAGSIGTLTKTQARLIRPALRAFMNKGLDAFVRQLSERKLSAPAPDA